MDLTLGQNGPQDFQADLSAYRRLRYQLAELENSGDLMQLCGLDSSPLGAPLV